MLKKSSVFALITLGLVAACAPKNSNKFHTGSGNSVIQKGTKPQASIASTNDQILFALNEIGWVRRDAWLSVNPPNLSSKEGCVVRQPSRNQNAAYFLREAYDCNRASDESDAVTGQRFVLNGQQSFTKSANMFRIDGSFVQQAWTDDTPSLLAAQGTLSRRVQISIPTGAAGTMSNISDAELASSVFNLTSVTDYTGDVAEESKRSPETYKSTMTATFSVATATPVKLLAGTRVGVSYSPETEQGTKRSAQVVDLTATSDITWVDTNGCTRPVGTFTLSDGSTQVATLTTNETGYLLSTEKPDAIHVWGKRCLEH